MRLWDATTRQDVLSLRGHTSAVCGVAYSPDGRQIASASGDGTVKLWNAATGQEIRTLTRTLRSGQLGVIQPRRPPNRIGKL